MTNQISNEMLLLLQALSVYKAIDEDVVTGTENVSEAKATDERDTRRLKIKQEMHDLAFESKRDRT